MKLNHDDELAGHFGIKKTMKRISSKFYWPKMRKMIKDYVSSCEKCQKRKSDNQKKSGQISPVAIIESFFMTIHADKYGPLPK